MSAANGLFYVFCVVDYGVEKDEPGHVVFVGMTEHWKRRQAEIRRGYRSSKELAAWLAEKGDMAGFRCVGRDLDWTRARALVGRYAEVCRARFNRRLTIDDVVMDPILSNILERKVKSYG